MSYMHVRLAHTHSYMCLHFTSPCEADGSTFMANVSHINELHHANTHTHTFTKVNIHGKKNLAVMCNWLDPDGQTDTHAQMHAQSVLICANLWSGVFCKFGHIFKCTHTHTHSLALTVKAVCHSAVFCPISSEVANSSRWEYCSRNPETRGQNCFSQKQSATPVALAEKNADHS